MPFNHSSPNAQLTAQQQACIGRFVTEWANTEFYLGLLLGRLLGTPEYLARTYTDFLGASQMQQAVSQALEIHHHRFLDSLIEKSLSEEISLINRRIEMLRSLRNKFAHYCWARTTDEVMFGTPLSGASPETKKGRRAHIEITVEEIDRSHDDLFAINSRFEEIVLAIPEVQEGAYIETFKRARVGA